MLNLGAPLIALTADMVPDNPVTWLFHCHFGEHMEDGMSARYRVVPMDSPLVETSTTQWAATRGGSILKRLPAFPGSVLASHGVRDDFIRAIIWRNC